MTLMLMIDSSVDPMRGLRCKGGGVGAWSS
jgi:hypothetical protein